MNSRAKFRWAPRCTRGGVGEALFATPRRKSVISGRAAAGATSPNHGSGGDFFGAARPNPAPHITAKERVNPAERSPKTSSTTRRRRVSEANRRLQSQQSPRHKEFKMRTSSMQRKPFHSTSGSLVRNSVFPQDIFLRLILALAVLCWSFGPTLAQEVILQEDFEDESLDHRITIHTVGSFISQPGIKTMTLFGSAKAFGYGRSTCGASCFDAYVTNLKITLAQPTYVATISFKEMELYGNWGSKGKIYLDGANYSWGSYNENEDFGRQPTNDGYADTEYRSHDFAIDCYVTVIELVVADITNQSEIFLDDLAVVSGSGTPDMPQCGEVLLAEDFESCPPGTWIGDCNGWQTWANGDNPGAFYITQDEHVSGLNSLHVAGEGSCWEGAAFKYFEPRRHLLFTTMMKSSGSGPIGCHHYQNGFDVYPALWSFDMPEGDDPGGLRCSVAGGGVFTAVEGFYNAAGSWYAAATELDYDAAEARFWLDENLVWSAPFDTSQAAVRVWLRSGEGYGWFDDVRVCEVIAPSSAADDPKQDLGVAGLVLRQNVPNPFTGSTRIGFELRNASPVMLTIFDVAGRVVRVLDAGVAGRGRHSLTWNGADAAGRRLPGGVYFYELSAGGHRVTRKLVVSR
ncbi:MAG: T9SS type A sorting domain-containing protein [Candidatus Eisenbacteria bacterium]|nr:T9SS type A sorting domain-containing protein [Candidatus Eisenbacteria bacterium]